MGEVLPDGTIQDYVCAFCHKPCNIQGLGHGRGVCDGRCARCTDPARERCCESHGRLVCSACRGTDQWMREHPRQAVNG